MAHSSQFSPQLNDLIDQMEQFAVQAGSQMDANAERISRDERGGQPVSCKACTEPGCCYQVVYIHLWEIFPIVREVLNQGLDSPAYRERLQELAEQMETSTKAGWFDRRVPCVFLENKRCKIYPVRPMNCRTYMVFSPAEICSAPTGTVIQMLDNGPVLNASTRFGADVHKALELKETNKRLLFGSMPRLLLLMLEALDREDWRDFIRRQPWPSDKTIVRWFEGDNPIREKLHQIRRSASGD